MKKLWAIPLVLLTGLAWFGMKSYNASSADEMPLLATWQPDAAGVAEQVSAQKGNLLKQEATFADLLTKRYRKHNPAIAARILFPSPGVIQLDCPGRMEPWNMDRMALDIWSEATHDLNHPFHVEIYHSFAFGSFHEGTLSPMPEDPSRLSIVYHPQDAGFGHDKMAVPTPYPPKS